MHKEISGQRFVSEAHKMEVIKKSSTATCAVLNSNISRHWSGIRKKFMALIDTSLDKHANIDV